MKPLSLYSLNKVFAAALILLIVLNIIGAISEDTLFLQSIKPLFIPVFLIFFFINNKVNNISFVLFFLYSFLGDSASMFFSNEIFLKASSVMYFLSYICLLSFIIPKFKFEDFNKIIAIYLSIVLLINMFFLYVVYGILKNIIPDSLELFLFCLKSISLIVLVIIAFGVYINFESRQTILFLIMAMCFMFSDLLNYISQYYVYHWSFSMLDRTLHVLGLFYLFNFIIEFNKDPKQETAREDNLPAKNILA